MHGIRDAVSAPQQAKPGRIDRVVSRLRNRPDRVAGLDASDAAMEDFPVWEDWREYLDLVSWLVPDVYRHARAQMLGLVLLSVAGVGARAATIGSMILYIKARTTGEALVVAGLSLPTDATIPVFLLWGSIALGFTILTIAASYRADSMTFDLAQRYMEMAINRVLRHHATGRPFDLPEDVDSRKSEPIALMLRGDTYRLVRVVVQTLGVLLPAITLLVASAVLLLTNWLLTLVLVPALGIYSVGLGFLNRDVMRDAQKRQYARQQLNVDVRAVIGTLGWTRYAAGGEPEWLDAYPQRSWLQEVMGTFRRMILAKKRVGYLGDAFQGVALMLVLLVFGSLVADESTSWAVLLTYLMALGYATRSMGSVSQSVTVANRFIPQVRRYVLFMQMNPESEAVARSSDDRAEFRFEVQEERIPGSLEALEPKPGQILWCVLRDRVNTGSLGEVCFALAGGDPAATLRIESEMFFLGKAARLPERPIRSYLPPRLSARAGIEERVDAFLEALAVRSEFARQVGSLDTVLTAALEERLSPELRYALRLLPGALAESRLVVLNFDPLKELGEEFGRRVFSVLADRIVILISRWRRETPISGVAAILVIDGSKIRGIGDERWYADADWAWLCGDPDKPDADWSGAGDADDADELERLDDDD